MPAVVIDGMTVEPEFAVSESLQCRSAAIDMYLGTNKVRSRIDDRPVARILQSIGERGAIFWTQLRKCWGDGLWRISMV